MLKAYKCRIYPNASQRQLLAHHFGGARWVYNWALAQSKEYYEAEKKTLSRRELQDRLVGLKKTAEYSWLQDVNSQSLLAALFHLHKAYQNFFKKKARFPRFKKKHNRQTYACPQHVRLDEEKGLLHIPKIKTVTLSSTPSGKYYASVLVENTDKYPTSQPMAKENTLGIDLGLCHFVITSDGEKVSNPKYLKASLKRLGIAPHVSDMCLPTRQPSI